MKIKVVVTLKSGVLDPQGKAILQTLNGMNFKEAKEVRQGKYFDIEINSNNEKKAKSSSSTHRECGKISFFCTSRFARFLSGPTRREDFQKLKNRIQIIINEFQNYVGWNHEIILQIQVETQPYHKININNLSKISAFSF